MAAVTLTGRRVTIESYLLILPYVPLSISS